MFRKSRWTNRQVPQFDRQRIPTTDTLLSPTVFISTGYAVGEHIGYSRAELVSFWTPELRIDLKTRKNLFCHQNTPSKIQVFDTRQVINCVKVESDAALLPSWFNWQLDHEWKVTNFGVRVSAVLTSATISVVTTALAALGHFLFLHAGLPLELASLIPVALIWSMPQFMTAPLHIAWTSWRWRESWLRPYQAIQLLKSFGLHQHVAEPTHNQGRFGMLLLLKTICPTLICLCMPLLSRTIPWPECGSPTHTTKNMFSRHSRRVLGGKFEEAKFKQDLFTSNFISQDSNWANFTIDDLFSR